MSDLLLNDDVVVRREINIKTDSQNSVPESIDVVTRKRRCVIDLVMDSEDSEVDEIVVEVEEGEVNEADVDDDDVQNAEFNNSSHDTDVDGAARDKNLVEAADVPDVQQTIEVQTSIIDNAEVV